MRLQLARPGAGGKFSRIEKIFQCGGVILDQLQGLAGVQNSFCLAFRIALFLRLPPRLGRDPTQRQHVPICGIEMCQHIQYHRPLAAIDRFQQALGIAFGRNTVAGIDCHANARHFLAHRDGRGRGGGGSRGSDGKAIWDKFAHIQSPIYSINGPPRFRADRSANAETAASILTSVAAKRMPVSCRSRSASACSMGISSTTGSP